MQRRVARVGFDWKDMNPVLDKVEEEFAEFRHAVHGNNQREAEEELGDILFALVNVARHKNICAEDALRLTTKKFARRFRYIEDKYNELGKDIHAAQRSKRWTPIGKKARTWWVSPFKLLNDYFLSFESLKELT